MLIVEADDHRINIISTHALGFSPSYLSLGRVALKWEPQT